MTVKFDNTDRKHVIDVIQNHIGSKLSRITKKHIYLKDEAGKRYIVLGSVDDWHGIPDEVIEDVEENHPDSKLAIAIKKRKTLKIYLGEMAPFIKSLGQLKRIGNNKYTFHVDEKHDLLTVREARTVNLDLLTEVPHSESDRTNTKNKEEINKLLKNMTQSEREALIRKVKNGDI